MPRRAGVTWIAAEVKSISKTLARCPWVLWERHNGQNETVSLFNRDNWSPDRADRSYVAAIEERISLGRGREGPRLPGLTLCYVKILYSLAKRWVQGPEIVARWGFSMGFLWGPIGNSLSNTSHITLSCI
jgi:hypothetical protein